MDLHLIYCEFPTPSHASRHGHSSYELMAVFLHIGRSILPTSLSSKNAIEASGVAKIAPRKALYGSVFTEEGGDGAASQRDCEPANRQ